MTDQNVAQTTEQEAPVENNNTPSCSAVVTKRNINPITTPKLIAYGLNSSEDWSIVHAAPVRRWMDQTRERFAYRCLPLRQANELGYWILSPTDVYITWDGTDSKDALKVTLADEKYSTHIKSHFGSGILTFNIPWFFRTNVVGLGLRVGGACNMPPPQGLYPLDGLVETWEQNSTFTMNWKVLEANRQLMISAGYPICAISFYDWWSFQIEFEGTSLDKLPPQDRAEYEEWREHRRSVLEGKPIDDVRNHYTHGKKVDGNGYKLPHWIRLHSKPVNQPVESRASDFYNFCPVDADKIAAANQEKVKKMEQFNWYQMLIRLRTELAEMREPDAPFNSMPSAPNPFEVPLEILEQTSSQRSSIISSPGSLSSRTTLQDILKLENEDLQFLAIQRLKINSVALGFVVPKDIMDLEMQLCQ